MSAILGQYGALIWQYFPESREALTGLVTDELRRAIDDDRRPDDIPVYDYTIYGVNPLVRELDAPGTGDLVRRFAQFCRALLTYSGPDAMDVAYHLDVTLLEYTDVPGTAAAVAAVDPELVELIRARYRRWRD